MAHQIKQFAHQLLGAVFSHKTFTAAAFFALLLTTWIGVQAMRSSDEQNIDADRVLEIDEGSWPKGVIELVEVKDWKSLDFPKGFEIKVRNVSTKPIYYCQIEVLFPESVGILGKERGIPMFYGDRRLLKLSNSYATEKDLPVQPGEIITLPVPQGNLDNFYKGLDAEARTQMMDRGIKRVLLIPQVVNFGDGTGYITSKPYPTVAQ